MANNKTNLHGRGYLSWFAVILLICFMAYQFLMGYSMPKYVKLATIVEGDPEVSFSIFTTLCVGKGATPFPGLLNFTLDPYL